MSEWHDRTREKIARAHAHGPDEFQALILTILEDLMEAVGAIDALQTEFDQYKTDVGAAFSAIDTAMGDFTTKVNDLSVELQNAGVDPAKLAALTADIEQARTVAQAEAAKVTAADPGAPAAAVATPAAAAPADPAAAAAPAEPAAAAASTKASEYTFDGDPTTVDVNQWTLVSEETAEATPRRLYTFAGDMSPGQTSGDGLGGVWHLYTGPTQPVGGSPAV